VHKYQAMIFDLDDTLLDRDKALAGFLRLIIEKCYQDIDIINFEEMLMRFREIDRHGHNSNKVEVLAELYKSHSPAYMIPEEEVVDYWNNTFPSCFTLATKTIETVTRIKETAQVAIITNGVTKTQRSKIENSGLAEYFDTILISQEVGISKPDRRIFQMALAKLKVKAEETLFVGDNLEGDIAGCQSAGIKGIWINPWDLSNNTDIKPYQEIKDLSELLVYFA